MSAPFDNPDPWASRLASAYPILGALGRSRPELTANCLRSLTAFGAFREHSVVPAALALDQSLALDPKASLEPILTDACRHHLWSLPIPRSLGGGGIDLLALAVGLEHLAAACAAIANLVATHGLALALVTTTGDVSQLWQLARRIVKGERDQRPYLLATAATEAAVGSDLESLCTLAQSRFEGHAQRTRRGWRLFARKLFVSNGSLASAYVVLVPTDRRDPARTLSAFLVDRDTPGVSIPRVEHKLGQRACPAAEVLFDGCELPETAQLNAGASLQRPLELVLAASRSIIGAFGSGIAHGVALQARRDVERVRAGSSSLLTAPAARAVLARLWQNARLARASYLQAILANNRFGLLSLTQNPWLARLDGLLPESLVNRGASHAVLGLNALTDWLRHRLSGWDQQALHRSSAEGSAAKLDCGKLALQNCELAMDLLGSLALREDSGYPKRLRDARLLSIYEGTDEIVTLDVAERLDALLAEEAW